MANIVTPEFRASYPALLQPKKNDLSGENEFSVVALFKKGEDLSVLKKACEDALAEKFGTDRTKWPKGLKTPFRDQAEKEKGGVLPAGYEAGAYFCTFKTKVKPGIVDGGLHAVIDPSVVYGGCYMKASVRAGAWEGKKDGKVVSRGVSLFLQNIQITRNGEPLGMPRVAAEKEFAPVAGSGAAEGTSDLFGSMK